MRCLGRTFDKNPADYRLYRPGYPAGLPERVINTLGLGKGCRILEIGCGAGQATALFAGLLPSQVCIDPGPGLLKQCRAAHGDLPGYSFVQSSFEDLQCRPGSFDLIYAATCFHWLVPGLRFQKAHRLLSRGGGLAVFTHRHVKGWEGFFTDVQSVYRREAPELVRPVSGVTLKEEGFEENPLKLLHESEFDQENTYTGDEYTGLLRTFSDHISLGEERLGRLCSGVRDLIDEKYGGRVSRTLTTHLSIFVRV